MATKNIITVGSRFSKLTAIEPLSQWKWLCLCDCGNQRILQHKQLIKGDNKSCGCLGTGAIPKHGHSRKEGKSLTYKCWRSMMQRCYRVKDKNYERYGLRGIYVCERWHDFSNFLADMGEVPIGLTIDRKDSTGNYEPDNCRWATTTEQCRNRSITVMLAFRGEVKPMAEWAEMFGINYNCLRRRIAVGWPVEKALSTKKMSITECAALGGKTRWAASLAK